ncbi:uncharacterized protein LOC112491738 isoform X2 [Ziziphus jujuba]|uniref:Uncharacterized protein LOC112491738 isoform X2 n=1 Tax=Ziziphus jujuba TaxID=326968 RepID=A0ABM3IK43_ZIZJJ|nr:uncharacterized protein LOC112491738 isoform X2 [Ziziphus jujuba]
MLRLLNKNQNQNSVWQINKSAAMADRFSTLPEHIIHNIMSFLPSIRDAMALSMVSRTFSSAFLCLPIMDMDMDYFFFSDLKSKQAWFSYALLSIVERCCPTIYTELYLAEILGWSKEDAQTLKLEGCCKFKEISFQRLEYLHSLEFDSVDFMKVEMEAPNLVSLIYNSESARSPEINICSTNLKHLQFEGANVPKNWVAHNFSEFPFLETLKLIGSHRWMEIKFHLENLNALELDSVDFTQVEIEAPNLVSLIYKSISNRSCSINISSSSSTNLKQLQFEGVNVPQNWVAQNFSEFRFLETLKLTDSHWNLREIKFHLENLNALELDSVNFWKVEIEAPNLVSLIYKSGYGTPLEINISSSSTSLKHLQFEGKSVPKRWVAENFSEFCFLETLKLNTDCPFPSKKFKFQLQCLKVLILNLKFTRSELFTCEIEAPNLVSFMYMNEDDGWNSSTSVRVTPLVTFTSKAKPNVILDVSSSEHENNFSSWMHYIRYMKSDFRKNMVIPLSNFKHLKVESQGSHPNTLSFIVDKQVKSLKFYYKKENIESWQLDLEKK